MRFPNVPAICYTDQKTRLPTPCLLSHHRFKTYRQSAVKETRIGTDQGRANRLSGKEGKGAWLGCWRTDCCGMGNGCEATHKGMGHLQEEADTRMVLHALDATNDGATKLSIHLPDPDVLVLAIRRYLEMCPNTSVVTRKGTNHQFIKLQSLVLLRQPRCPHLTPSQELIILVAFQRRGRSVLRRSFRKPTIPS